MKARWRLRQLINLANLSTPLGIVLALAGHGRLTRGADGLLVAHGVRLPVRAPAFTLGNVVLVQIDEDTLARRPTLLVHEARHCTQYAWCLGPGMLPLYGLAALWSWLRCRDPSSYNVFEMRAGLADGGYRDARDRRLA